MKRLSAPEMAAVASRDVDMLYPIQNGVRNRLDLSGIWDFQTDPEEVGEGRGWASGLPDPRPIAVPGSWNEQYADLYDYLGLGWYLTRTYVPRGWRGERIFIRIGSANYSGTVYVNGEWLGQHEGGHLPFAFEVTEHVRWDGENTIAIAVENHLTPTRVPAGNIPSPLGSFASYPRTTFDFFPFAGLHRPVALFTVPRIHIRDVSVVTGVDGADGTVSVTVRASESSVATGSARLVGGESVVGADLAFADGTARAELRVPNARLWSDADPYLYGLTVELDGQSAGDIRGDRYTLPVGIRTVEVRGKEILLNGGPVKLNGFGRHEDFYASGKGLNLPLLVKDYGLMRWVGARSYRTSHYPYSEEEMQLADRGGFLVIDEIPAVSLQFEDDENAAERLTVCQQQLAELIARDKNHPSVVMWSVANEPLPARLSLAGAGAEAGERGEDPSVARGKAFLDTLLGQARHLDPTRPVTLVGVMGGPPEWLAGCDVVCLNRYWGWYVDGGQLEQGLKHLEAELDATWNAFHKPIVLTEFGADTVPGLHGQPAVMWTEEYQADLIRGYLEVAARKDYVVGMQVWSFADFAAVQSPMRVGGLNLKGVFTRAREPKLAAHVLRELWGKGRG